MTRRLVPAVLALAGLLAAAAALATTGCDRPAEGEWSDASSAGTTEQRLATDRRSIEGVDAARATPPGAADTAGPDRAPRAVRVDVRLPAEVVQRLGPSPAVHWWFARRADHTLLRAGTGTARLRLPAPSGADVLLLCAPGCELECVPLGSVMRGRSTAPTVALARAEQRATVEIDGRRHAGTTQTLRLTAELTGPWRLDPDADRDGAVTASMAWSHAVEADRVEVAVPRGFWTWATLRSDRGIAYPAHHVLVPGSSGTFGFPSLRKVTLHHAGADVSDVHLLPDRRATPDAEPDELAALDVLVSMPSRRSIRSVGRSTVLVGVPSVPHHLCVRIAGRSALLRLEADCDELRLPAAAPRRPLPARLLLDGRPAPANTLVLPGRLDLGAAQELAVLAQSQRDLVHVVAPTHDVGAQVRDETADRGSTDGVPDLPASDWLTLLHPDHGLAWGRHTDDRCDASTQPGCIAVRSPGRVHDGWIVLRTTWPGSDDQWPAPATGLLPTRLDSTGTTLVRGLPPARYRVWIEWWHAEEPPAELRRHMETVELTDARPTVRIEVPTGSETR